MTAPLSRTIRSKRVQCLTPDDPVIAEPLCLNDDNDPQNFDALLDHALSDLKVRLLKAHQGELRRNAGACSAVSQNGGHETQVDFHHVVSCHSAAEKPSSNLSGQDVATTHVIESPARKNLRHQSSAVSVVSFVNNTSTGSRGSTDSRRRHRATRRKSNRFSVSGVVTELREAVFNRRVSRMHAALADHRVMVNRHLLKQRLSLEHNLVVGSWKFLRWLLCFVPLLWCLNVYEPGADIGSVHEMLIEHYGLGHNALLELKEWDHVYDFFKKFKEQNDLLEPTGQIFWCDPRYLDILGITTAGATEYQRQRELANFLHTSLRRLEGNNNSEYAGETKSQLLSRLRRLTSSYSTSSLSASTSPSTPSLSLEALLLVLKHVYQNPTPLGVDPHGHERLLFDCRTPTDKELVDIHHKLEQARAGNNTVGIRRRRTDGYGPLGDYKKYFPNEFNETYLTYLNHQFVNQTEPDTGTYLSKYHYPYSAVSLFDPVIYQDRYALHECKKDTFADYFTNQGWNIFSPVFGQSAPKAVDILECVDRRKHVHDKIAADIDTDRFTYMGHHIYARLAGQAGDHTGPDFQDWRRIGWLGKQTETATISVLIYIDGLEMFTSLAVHFTQGAGGSITCHRAIASVVEMKDRGTEWLFHVCSFATCFNCLICLIYDLSNCQRMRMEDKRLDNSCLYEVFARLTMLMFAISLEFLYMGRETMVSLFKDAFDTFLYRSDFSHTGQVKALQHFFEVKEHIHAMDAVHMNVKIAGTFVYVFQVFQLILLLGAHPRVDLLCSTIVKTINGLIHYTLIFFVIFSLLGYYAHWMFASTLPNLFGSFTSAIMRQIEMIVGYADAWPWEDIKLMSSVEFVCFCMYLLTYFGLVFLILLNFFIAIILEGFFGVWKTLTEENAGGSGKWFPLDMWHAWKGACVHRRKGWPSRIDIITRVESFEQMQKQWDTFESKKTDTQLLSEVILVDEYGFDDEEAALDFLTTYSLRAPLILDLKPKKDTDSFGKAERTETRKRELASLQVETAETQGDFGVRALQHELSLDDHQDSTGIIVCGTLCNVSI